MFGEGVFVEIWPRLHVIEVIIGQVCTFPILHIRENVEHLLLLVVRESVSIDLPYDIYCIPDKLCHKMLNVLGLKTLKVGCILISLLFWFCYLLIFTWNDNYDDTISSLMDFPQNISGWLRTHNLLISAQLCWSLHCGGATTRITLYKLRRVFSVLSISRSSNAWTLRLLRFYLRRADTGRRGLHIYPTLSEGVQLRSSFERSPSGGKATLDVQLCLFLILPSPFTVLGWMKGIVWLNWTMSAAGNYDMYFLLLSTKRVESLEQKILEISTSSKHS